MASDPKVVSALRALAHAALQMRDQRAFDAVAFAAALAHIPEADFERMAREELAKLPHATHEWWEGPCNCRGQLN